MVPFPPQSRRWPRIERRLLALGPLKSTALLTLGCALVTIALGQLVWWLTGGGAPWRALEISLVSAALVTPLVAFPLLRLLSDLEATRVQLDILATRDELTGIPNRRHFLLQADREWSRCRRYEMDAAFLMIDVDRFKQVNDQHGHLAGDLMLREISRVIGDTLRQPDLLGRFGGEEFTVFLPHADPLGALDVAERIRDRIAQLRLEWHGKKIRTTVSIGSVALDASHDTLGALIADADLALFAAKAAGRNCVRTSPARPSTDRVSGTAQPHNQTGRPSTPRRGTSR
jgi:diguanylate cyclase (GGDEF)-like protein